MLTGISRLSTVDAGGLFCGRIAVDIRGLPQGCHFPPATFADRGWPAPGASFRDGRQRPDCSSVITC
jgi:hypothetical protein